MPKVGPDDVQINYVMPRTLDEKVRDYQFARRLPHKSMAYRELIERGLEAAAGEDVNKVPKS